MNLQYSEKNKLHTNKLTSILNHLMETHKKEYLH